MNKRVILLLVVVALCGAIWFVTGLLFGSAEPVWEGKKLSQWLTETRSDDPRDLTPPARHAVQAMGTNALPFLLSMVGTTDSRFKTELHAWAGKGSFIGRLTRSTYSIFRIRGAAGFEALGKEAAPAVPDLIKLLHNEKTEYPAAVALGGIGQPAVPLLVQALTNQSAAMRLSVVVALNYVHDAEAAVPNLLICLDDPEPAIREVAAIALGDMHQQPAQVVPKLIERLSDTNSSVRADVALALKLFKTQAYAAIPKLTELQNDPDAEVRQGAASALKEVQVVSEDKPSSLNIQPGKEN